MDLTNERVRRVVCGHDQQGRAVIDADEWLSGSELAEDSGRPDVTFFHLWATREMPVDLSEDAAQTQRLGSVETTVGSGSGSVLRLGVLAPGTRSPMHRTESLDYGLVLEGECDMELDGGEVTTVRAGDVIIQRGTSHRWHNRSDAPVRFAWILLDAVPVSHHGRLGAQWGSEEEMSP
jgi:quercetin dioxygenase-like cupin family protein